MEKITIVYKNKKRRFSVEICRFFGAGSGGRTRTMLPPRDFESRTSANSVIPAYERIYFTISFFKMQEFLSQK